MRLFRNKKTSAIFSAAALIVGVALTCSTAESYKTINNLSRWSSWSATPSNSSYTLSEDKGDGSPDQDSAKIESKPRQVHGFATLYEAVNATPYIGKTIEFSADIKTSAVNGTATLWVMANESDHVFAFDDMSERGLSGTNDWTREKIVLKIPQGSQKILVGMRLQKGGTAWFRRLKFEVVDDSTPTTSSIYDPERFSILSLDNAPKNLSFENKGHKPRAGINKVWQWGTHSDKEDYYVKYGSADLIYRGKPIFELGREKDSKDGFLSMYQSFLATKYRGKRVRFSADIKNANKDTWTTIFAQINDPNSVIAFDAMEKHPLKISPDWSHADVVLDVPDNSSKIKIGFIHSGPGKSYIGNCNFEVVSKDVPATAASTGSEALPEVKYQDKPDFRFD